LSWELKSEGVMDDESGEFMERAELTCVGRHYLGRLPTPAVAADGCMGRVIGGICDFACVCLSVCPRFETNGLSYRH